MRHKRGPVSRFKPRRQSVVAQQRFVADLIDGEIIMHSPVSLPHGNLTNFLDRLLAAYVERRDLGVVHREVIAVRLAQRTVVMPDIAFYTHEQAGLFQAMHIPVAPARVAEVLSPVSAGDDVGRKFAKYEEHGVKEYWIHGRWRTGSTTGGLKCWLTQIHHGLPQVHPFNVTASSAFQRI